MTRFFTLVVALLHIMAVAAQANLWTGNETMNWSNYVQIDGSKFANANIADRIVLGVTNISAPDTWPQIRLNWGQLPGAGTMQLQQGATSATFYITADMLNVLKAQGLAVEGTGYTLTSVNLEQGNGGAGYENSVWIGNTVFGNDWGTYETIPALSFTYAETGDLLRMKVTNLQAGAQGHIVKTNWEEMPDATEFIQLAGNYFQFTVTDAMLAELKENGMIVNGIGYTLTSVDVIDPATIVPLTLNVPVTGDDWVWNKDETPSVQVSVTNPTGNQVTANAAISIRTDKMEPVMENTQSVTIAANSSQTVTFDLALENPGFYQCTISVNDELARSFNIGYAPTNIVSEPDAQSNFDSFWNDVLTELGKVEPEYTLTELPEHSSAERKVYLVE